MLSIVDLGASENIVLSTLRGGTRDQVSVGGIMSTPVRKVHDNGRMIDSLSTSAQETTRLPQHEQNSVGESPRVHSPPPPAGLEASEPPWKRNKQHGMFAGDDVAVAGQGFWRALAPDRIPDLPLPDSHAWTIPFVRGIMVIAAVVAAGIGGYLWASARPAPPTEKLALSLDRTNWQPELGTQVPNIEASRPNNVVVDRKNLQLEGSGSGAVGTPKSAPLGGDADDNASMMRKGADFIARRDIAAARLIFQRVAQSSDAAAAFALAETYDPLVLRKLGSREEGFSDIALAQSWYEKARDLGSTVALERIVSLTQASK